jgi:hypothetical protein
MELSGLYFLLLNDDAFGYATQVPGENIKALWLIPGKEG